MKKVIVIGAGIAGLSAGCFARMNGYEAAVFEMNALPGGLCTAWERNGFTFDSGIQYLNGSKSGTPWNVVWRELGALKEKKVYYKSIPVKVCLKERIVNLYNDPDKLKEYLKEIAPEDTAMIDELAYAVNMFYSMEAMPFFKPKELLGVADVFRMLKSVRPILALFKKYRNTSINEFASMFKNPILRKAIRAISVSSSTENCLAVPSILANRDSGFPEGGSLEFAKSIERRFTGLGGTVRYGAKVTRVLTENGKAAGLRLGNGEEVKGDIVISASDGYNTIFRLLDRKFTSKKIRRIYEEEPVVPSNLQISIGLKESLLSGKQDFTEYIYELGEPIVIAGEKKEFMVVRPYSFESAFAPEGKSVITVAFPCDSKYWERIYSDKAKYRKEKGSAAETVISALEKIYPGIRENIEALDIATPMTYIRYTANRKGSSLGFVNFFNLNIPRTLPGLKDFYMAGQWVGDSGLIGAARSGRDIIQVICSRDKKAFRTEEA